LGTYFGITREHALFFLYGTGANDWGSAAILADCARDSIDEGRLPDAAGLF
jgi:hypothetical protein